MSGTRLLKPYERLAPYYHQEWAAFAAGYPTIIRSLGLVPTSSGAVALDLACGTGVLVAELAKMGFTVTGLDISQEMLSVARAQYPGLQFVYADMCKFRLDREFDLITCTFDSLNYLTTEAEVLATFRAVSLHLAKEGRFLFVAPSEAWERRMRIG